MIERFKYLEDLGVLGRKNDSRTMKKRRKKHETGEKKQCENRDRKQWRNE